MPNSDKTKFVSEALKVYGRMVSYLEQWFDFSDKYFFYLCRPLALEAKVDMVEVCELPDSVQVTYNDDAVFSEVNNLNDFIESDLKQLSSPSVSSAEDLCKVRLDLKWLNFSHVLTHQIYSALFSARLLSH